LTLRNSLLVYRPGHKERGNPFLLERFIAVNEAPRLGAPTLFQFDDL